MKDKIKKIRTKHHQPCQLMLMRWVYACLISAFFLTSYLLPATPKLADAHEDPSLQWKTLETEHFDIHFPHIYEAFARYVAAIAEEAHGELSPILGATPTCKTQIAISSYNDEFNGSATIVPQNIIQVYAYPPNGNSELSDYDDWVRTLLYHEYTHLLHMSTIGKFHANINQIFGQIASSNVALPRWYLEGLAVVMETEMSNAGRLRNTLYRTMLRNAALYDKIPSLSELSNEPEDWPAANGLYIFGAHFLDFLKKKYGLNTLVQFNHEYSKEWIPYALNRIALRVWNKNFSDLYELWQQDATGRALADKITLSAKGKQTPFLIPNASFQRNSAVTHKPDKDETISYLRNDGHSRRKIVTYNFRTQETKDLLECYGTCKHIWNKDGNKLLLLKAAYKDALYFTQDLWLYDTETKKSKQLTNNLRVKDFAWKENTTTNGELSGTIYLVSQMGPTASIIQLDIPNLEYKTIYETQLLEQLDDIQLLDDEDLIFSRFDNDIQKRRISIFSIRNKSWKHLTDDKAQNIAPVPSNDRKKIWFVSDKTGFFNLYSLNIDTGEIYRVTNLNGGILYPDIDEARKAVYGITYTPTGLAPMRISMNDLDYHSLSAPNEQSSRTEKHSYPTATLSDKTAQPYRAYHWLVPQTWVPLLQLSTAGISSIGLEFSAKDSISHHAYDISLALDLWAGHFDISASYVLSALPVDLIFSFSFLQYNNWFVDDYKYRRYEENRIYAYAAVYGYLSHGLTTHTLSAGFDLLWYGEANDSIHWTLSPESAPPILPEFGFYNALWIAWSMRNTRTFSKAISTSWGYNISAKALLRAPFLGAEKYEATFSATAKGYIPMPWLENHVLALRASAGAAYSEYTRRNPFALSTDTSISLGSLLSPSPVGTVLRGYPSRSVQGKYYLYGNIEYRFPIWYPNLAYDTVPLAFKRLYASFFVDWAYAWRNSPNFLASKVAIGAELHFDLALGYRLTEHFRLGYAWGAAPGGNHQVYFMVGDAF